MIMISSDLDAMVWRRFTKNRVSQAVFVVTWFTQTGFYWIVFQDHKGNYQVLRLEEFAKKYKSEVK